MILLEKTVALVAGVLHLRFVANLVSGLQL